MGIMFWQLLKKKIETIFFRDFFQIFFSEKISKKISLKKIFSQNQLFSIWHRLGATFFFEKKVGPKNFQIEIFFSDREFFSLKKKSWSSDFFLDFWIRMSDPNPLRISPQKTFFRNFGSQLFYGNWQNPFKGAQQRSPQVGGQIRICPPPTCQNEYTAILRVGIHSKTCPIARKSHSGVYKKILTKNSVWIES